jgi:hypothetical protein
MEVTARYLRARAALYRGKAAAAKNSADARRYRDFAELLDRQANLLETDGERNGSSPGKPQPSFASS